MGLLVAGLCSCGQVEVAEEASTAVTEATTEAEVAMALSENPWAVTIEQIDLDDPENRVYIDWAKTKPNWHNTRTFNEPSYFDNIDIWAYWERTREEPDPWTCIWEDAAKNVLREKRRPWNETKELVSRSVPDDEHRYEGYRELLIRDKATGATERAVVTGYDEWGPSIHVIEILSNTRFLYALIDNYSESFYLYDAEIGSVSITGGSLCDLGERRYLWSDWREGFRGTLYLIDMRKLENGEKDAKRELVNWGRDYDGSIQYLSSDKRFVYINHHRSSDYTWHRGVYDIETGEQVAFFQWPGYVPNDNKVLIRDDLEYVYYWAGDVDDPTIHYFYIIHYDMEGT